MFDIDNANKVPLPKDNMHYTMVFTAFVSMTLFNELNSRKVHGERNVFSGILKNYVFIAIWISTFIFTVSVLGMLTLFTRATLCYVARYLLSSRVRPFVCHKPVLYQNG